MSGNLEQLADTVARSADELAASFGGLTAAVDRACLTIDRLRAENARLVDELDTIRPQRDDLLQVCKLAQAQLHDDAEKLGRSVHGIHLGNLARALAIVIARTEGQ